MSKQKSKLQIAEEERVEILATQLGQMMMSAFVDQFRAETIAFYVLPRERYQKLLNDVADQSRKIVLNLENSKKCSNFAPDFDKNVADSPTPSKS